MDSLMIALNRQNWQK